MNLKTPLNVKTTWKRYWNDVKTTLKRQETTKRNVKTMLKRR